MRGDRFSPAKLDDGGFHDRIRSASALWRERDRRHRQIGFAMRRPPDASMADGHITGGLSALARAFMFATWAKIAVRQFNEAENLDPGDAYERYLLAITSAAFAIDGFRLDLPLGSTTGTPPACSAGFPKSKAHCIWWALTENFAVPTARTVGWHDELHWLFELRNDAVHYEGAMQALYQHPNGTWYEPNVGKYDRAAAARAIELARDIILTCIDHPQPLALATFITKHIGGSGGVDAFQAFTP